MRFALLPILLFIGVALAPAAEPKTAKLAGKYEAAARGKSFFSLEVQPAAAGFSVSFSAGNEDGSGAAPDGGGAGKLNQRDELEFTFEDSFANKGRGLLKRDGKQFIVTLDLTATEDSRAAVHYGERRLKRVAARPPTKRSP
jgi:hypothetical protein